MLSFKQVLIVYATILGIIVVFGGMAFFGLGMLAKSSFLG